MLTSLVVLLGMLIHLLIHVAEALLDLPRRPVDRDNEVEYQPVGQVEDKNKEKKS